MIAARLSDDRKEPAGHGHGPPDLSLRPSADRAGQLPIRLLAFLAVIASVGTVTFAGVLGKEWARRQKAVRFQGSDNARCGSNPFASDIAADSPRRRGRRDAASRLGEVHRKSMSDA